jgi:hypothetical protein
VRGAAALLAAVVALQGCRPDRAESHAVPTVSGAPLVIAPVPRLSVGVVDGDTAQQFDRVVTPFLLPSGALVVPDAGSKVIRVFNPDGSFARTLGREGEGPGEFSFLLGAWGRGDTIEAASGRRSIRITRFLPGGAVETVDLENVVSAQSALPGPMGDGWVLYGVQRAPENQRDDDRVHRFARSGAHAGEIGALPGMLRFVVNGFGGPTPLSPTRLLGIHGNQVYIAESQTPSIRVVDSTGALVREITWKPEAHPRVADILPRVIDSAVAATPAARREALRKSFAAAPPPDQVPVWWGLIVDARGFVWIRPFDPFRNAAALGGLRGAGPGGTWTVLTPEGQEVGKVAMPDDLEPTQITDGALVGIRRDELGVESVRVYDLTRAP